MTSYVEYLVCPFCGKTTPLTKSLGSFKVGDPAELAWIQTRECKGRKGFCKIETKTLRDKIKEYQHLADELVDFCSGILMVTMEENLPVHKPVFIQQFQKLKKQILEGTPEEESIRFELDDSKRRIKQLSMQLKKEKQIAEGKTFEVVDLKRENQKLKDEIRRLKHQIHAYERASFS